MTTTKSTTNIILLTIIALVALSLTGCTGIKVESIRNDPLVYAPSPIPLETTRINIEKGVLYPRIIEIFKGETVTFTNFDDRRHLIVSDPHPEHDQLPDLYSGWLIKDDTYQYKFIKSGHFGIHLEDNPSVSAEVIVK